MYLCSRDDVPFTYCYWISYHFQHDFFLRLCVNVRAGVAAAAWLSPSGCVGFDRAGPPGAAGQWGGDAERPAGRCWTPEQQSGTHCEFTSYQLLPPCAGEGHSQPSGSRWIQSFLFGETKIRRLKTLSQARWNTEGHSFLRFSDISWTKQLQSVKENQLITKWPLK